MNSKMIKAIGMAATIIGIGRYRNAYRSTVS